MPLSASVGKGGANIRADVLRIQEALNISRMPDKLPPIKVDGVVGPKTIAAIQEFQSRYTKVSDGRIDPHGPAARRLEEIVVAAIEPAVRAGVQRVLEGLSTQLQVRGLQLPRNIQSELDRIAAGVRQLRTGAAHTSIQFAVYYPSQRPAFHLAVAPAAAAAPVAVAAAEALMLALLAVIALMIVIQSLPFMGRALEDLVRQIQILMAKILDEVEEALEGIEDLVKRNSRAAMRCSAQLLLFRELSQRLLDLLKAPRSTDELGRKRFEKQLSELFDKWQEAMEALLTCLVSHGAT